MGKVQVTRNCQRNHGDTHGRIHSEILSYIILIILSYYQVQIYQDSKKQNIFWWRIKINRWLYCRYSPGHFCVLAFIAFLRLHVLKKIWDELRCVNPILRQCSISIPPENMKTSLVFWCFQGVWNRNFALKWVRYLYICKLKYT